MGFVCIDGELCIIMPEQKRKQHDPLANSLKEVESDFVGVTLR